MRNLNKSDLEDHKTLKTDLSLEKEALSLKLLEFLPNIPHADIIEEKAPDLLNMPNAITLSLSPTLLPTSKEKCTLLMERLIQKTTKSPCLRRQLLNAAAKVLDFQIFAVILLLCLKKRVF